MRRERRVRTAPLASSPRERPLSASACAQTQQAVRPMCVSDVKIRAADSRGPSNPRAALRDFRLQWISGVAVVRCCCEPGSQFRVRSRGSYWGRGGGAGEV